MQRLKVALAMMAAHRLGLRVMISPIILALIMLNFIHLFLFFREQAPQPDI